jgi:hypothetical protein
LVFALYLNSPDVMILYRHPELLWGICAILAYWLGRFCILTGPGEMSQDPSFLPPRIAPVCSPGFLW